MRHATETLQGRRQTALSPQDCDPERVHGRLGRAQLAYAATVPGGSCASETVSLDPLSCCVPIDTSLCMQPVLSLCSDRMNWLVASALLFVHASRATHINSEGLIVGEHLYRNLATPSEFILAAITQELPDTNFTITDVVALREKILEPSRVPAWLHRGIHGYISATGDSRRHYPWEGPFLAAILQESPATCPFNFKKLAVRSQLWLRHCVRKMLLFPSLNLCRPAAHNVDFGQGPEPTWELSDEAVTILIEEWMMSEYNRLTTPVIAVPSTTTTRSPTTKEREKRKRSNAQSADSIH